MYAVGHLALGYLTGKATSKLLNVNVNIPLLFLASIIPDIDLLIPGLQHRGPTHSLVVSILVFIPLVAYYGKKAIPYFIALTQHSLIGDYITGGGIQLLWPLNSTHYHGLTIEITSLTNITIEWIFFLTAFTILVKTKDAQTLLQPHPSNMLLSIPTFTVLLPTILSFPQYVPATLIIPHLAYLIVFTISIFIDFKALLKKN
jgi:membrane-bound metal-dependent hydrolase YbcI (DUF457 family)